MLKMNNHAILNALDLKERFSAWDALQQLEEAAAFARIHCLRLVTILKSKEKPGEGNAKFNASGQYAAMYLDKSFWLRILEKGMKPAAWDNKGKNVNDCMQAVLKDGFSEEEMAPDEAERLQQEYTDGMIGEKLQHIVSSGKLADSGEDARTAVLLLALCELAEVDVFQYSFRRWDEEQPKRPFPEHEKPGHLSEKTKETQKCGNVRAEELPNVAALQLKARRMPYCFCCYARDDLNAGDQIRVVRIEACAGRDQYNKAVVRLIHPETNQILRTVEIPAGEYRDCTAVNGRIIKFLPTMAVSKNLCVVRNPAEGHFEVVPFGSNAWRIGMDPSLARTVTCLAAGELQEQGFLFVADGKVISSFYKPAEDYDVRMDLQMIFDTIVEASIEPEGYRLLTSAGTVISDIPKWNGAKGVVSLSDLDRRQELRIDHPGNVAEAVMSVTGDSLVIRDGRGKLDVIFGDDPARSFRKSADGSIRISSKEGFADE